jgi:hypothetical protein
MVEGDPRQGGEGRKGRKPSERGRWRGCEGKEADEGGRTEAASQRLYIIFTDKIEIHIIVHYNLHAESFKATHSKKTQNITPCQPPLPSPSTL